MASRFGFCLLAALVGVCTLAHCQMFIVQSSETKQQATLWSAIKNRLTAPKGREFFELNLRYAVVPGSAQGIQLLRGTVVSGEPSTNPAKLLIALRGTAVPEVALLLRSPWDGPIPSGTEVEFSGVPVSFTSEPFLLTFDVEELALLPAQKLALEITDAKGAVPFFVVLNGDGYLLRYGQSLAQLLLSADTATSRQPSALRLGYKFQQDIISLNISVCFEPVAGTAKRTLLNRLPFQTVGTYSARLNDVILLSDLERVNLRPLTVKIVTADPSTPTRPMTISNVPSVRMEVASEDRTTYHLLLHNVSSQSVTALLIDLPISQGGASTLQEGDGSHVVIEPGGTDEVNFPKTAADLGPLEIVLEAAIFHNGTVEGNRHMVATVMKR